MNDIPMGYTDPNYLRIVYDGLESGAYDRDNAAALPDGLVGLYESAIPSTVDVRLRQYFMDFFTAWSLVKDDAGLEFVHSLLPGWTVDEVRDHVQRHSRWFNAKDHGRLQLYHERLRAFFLQRASESRLKSMNDSILGKCRNALAGRTGDEWETYALQHMSTHLLLPAMLSGEAVELKSMAYDTLYWDRQVAAAKAFDWTRRMLDDVMVWSYRHDEGGLIECALNFLDLYHREQNDAAGIVRLVADGDVETALQRIGSFGGSDEQGLKRRFMLYMLCLMELTLLDGRSMPDAPRCIRALLQHLDENLPEDHSILNWGEFFPSRLMFLMACECAKIGLNYGVLYRNGDTSDDGWIIEKGPYSDLEFEILRAWARSSSAEGGENRTLKFICTELAKQQKIEVAVSCVEDIKDVNEKDSAFGLIVVEVARQGNIKEAHYISAKIGDISSKILALANISGESGRQGRSSDAASAMRKALEMARSIEDDYEKCIALSSLSTALLEQGDKEQAASEMIKAIENAKKIVDKDDRIGALQSISIELVKQGKVEDALDCLKFMGDATNENFAKQSISIELAKQGKKDEAFGSVVNISGAMHKANTLASIAVELAIQGEVEEAISVALGIGRGDLSSPIYAFISIELAKLGKKDEAVDSVGKISKPEDRVKALAFIAVELARQGEVEEAISTALGIGIRGDYLTNRIFASISNELAKQGKIQEAEKVLQECLVKALGINDASPRIGLMQSISTEMAKMHRLDLAETSMKKAISLTRDIIDEYEKCDTLFLISIGLSEQGRMQESVSVMRDVLTIARDICDEEEENRALQWISAWQARLGRFEEAIEMANKISYDSVKCRITASISTEYLSQGNVDGSASVLQIALSSARRISDDYEKSFALLWISIEMSKQGRRDDAEMILNEAEVCCQGISQSNLKSISMASISTGLFSQGRLDESDSVMQEALAIARSMPSNVSKFDTLLLISKELALQGRVGESAKLMLDVFDSAGDVSDESGKSWVFSSVSTEMAKHGHWISAEMVGLKIPLMSGRHDCWKAMAVSRAGMVGWKTALKESDSLQSDESRLFYIKGLIDSIGFEELDVACFRDVFIRFVNDPESLRLLLQLHALNVLFLGKDGRENLQRMNRTLDIQWAIDIAAGFPG